MSKLTLYGVGMVAMDKNPDTWTIEVFPIEKLPNASGDITGTTPASGNFTDAFGGKIPYNVSRKNTITAEWLSFGHYNRASAPDVCKGEYVILFKYGGEDRYYWMNMFSEFDLRKKETVMYFFSNKSDQVDQGQLAQKGYYFKVDTLNKEVALHTDNGDGEQSGYDLVINTGEGKLSITDTNENTIELDSVGKILTITIGDKININFKGIAISNGQYELITVLEEFIDTIIKMQHIGNLGAPTNIFPASQLELEQLKQKITSFKG